MSSSQDRDPPRPIDPAGFPVLEKRTPSISTGESNLITGAVPLVATVVVNPKAAPGKSTPSLITPLLICSAGSSPVGS